MKSKSIMFFLLTSFIIVSLQNQSYGQGLQTFKKYKKKYKPFLNKGSKVIDAGVTYMLEKTKKKTFVQKQFNPDLNQITHYYTFSKKNLKTLEGKAMEWWDNGNMRFKGHYKKNVKSGIWNYYSTSSGHLFSQGEYVDGEKDGLWKEFNEDSLVVRTLNYSEGIRQGAYNVFNDKGELIEKGVYEDDEIIEKEVLNEDEVFGGEVFKLVETMPTFKGCESLQDEKERKKCAENLMLRNIYGNIRYPQRARMEDIQGKCIAQFVVDKEGKIQDIQILRGICTEIGQEVYRVIENMPDWNPGMQDGKAVKVQFTLPVSFKLEG